MNRHICLCTSSREPSGVGEHMLILAAQLQQTHRVSFVCPASQEGAGLLDQAQRMGLPTFALDSPVDLQAGLALRSWLEIQQPDVFHCHAGVAWEGHTPTRAARQSGVPVVIRTEHLPYLITKPPEQAAYLRLEGTVDRFICVSEASRSTYLRAGLSADKVHVVHNGIDLRPVEADRSGIRSVLGLPSDARIVLTVGRFTEQKGYDLLLKAIPNVLSRDLAAYFLWVGSGPLENHLRRRVRGRHLHSRVSFLGRRDDVRLLMSASDLLVLPSRFEGHPLVVLEAMAAGLPVVGTRVCGITEAVEDGVTGRLVDLGDPAGLGSAIVEALQQPVIARRWGAAGRERVMREFSARRMAQEVLAIYEDCLAQIGLPHPVAPDAEVLGDPVLSNAAIRDEPLP